jgi:hypothetical protein
MAESKCVCGDKRGERRGVEERRRGEERRGEERRGEERRGGEEENRRGGEEENRRGGEEENRRGGEEENRRGGEEENRRGGEEENRRGGDACLCVCSMRCRKDHKTKNEKYVKFTPTNQLFFAYVYACCNKRRPGDRKPRPFPFSFAISLDRYASIHGSCATLYC